MPINSESDTDLEIDARTVRSEERHRSRFGNRPIETKSRNIVSVHWWAIA